MKLFSKKRWTALFVGGVLSLACLGAGIGALTNETALAADEYTRPEATNIEDLIDSHADFYLPRQNDTYDNQNSYWNTGTAVTRNGRQSFYYDKKTDDANNALDYDGNIFAYTLGAGSYNAWKELNPTNTSTTINVAAGVKLNRTAQTPYAQDLNAADNTANGTTDSTVGNGYGLISFRTQYTSIENNSGLIHLGMMVMDTYSYVIGDKGMYGKKGIFLCISTDETRIVSANYDNGPSYDHTDNNISYDTDLLITFGIYKASATVDNIYLKIFDVTNNRQVTEIDGAVPSACQPTYADDAATRTFSIARGGAAGTTTGDFPLLVAGVEEPIMPVSFTAEADAGVTQLKDVEIDDNWSFGDSTEIVKLGANAYTATTTQTGTYYGTSYTPTATVTITGKADYLRANAPTTTNVESVVSEYDDVRIAMAGSAYMSDWYTEEKSAGTYGNTSVRYNYLISTEKAASADSTNNFNYEYGGNLSVSFDEPNANYSAGTILDFVNTSANGMLSMRTSFSRDSEYLFCLYQPQDAKALKNGDLTYGYAVRLAYNEMLTVVKKTTSGSEYLTYNGSVSTASGKTETATVVDGKWMYTADDDKKVVQFTYGVSPVTKNGVTVNAIYFKMIGNDGKVLADIVAFDDEPSTVNLGTTNGVANTLADVRFHMAVEDKDNNTVNNASKGYADDVSPFSIQGVAAPLFMADYKDGLTLATGLVGEEPNTLASVELPTGYTWKNEEQALEMETSKYAAIYASDYYGNTVNVDVDLDVAVSGVRTTLKFLNGSQTLATKTLKPNATFDFSTLQITGVDTVIGWTEGSSTALLRPNHTFTATSTVDTTVEFNVVDMDMKLLDGASIRTTMGENGNGGIRFVAMFDADDWAANAAYINNAFGVIVPTDDATYFGANGFTAAARDFASGKAENNFKNQEAQDYTAFHLTEEAAGGYAMYAFSMTDVLYQNYSRTFAAMAYITVKYDDDSACVFETAYDAAKNSRTVFDVAVKAYADSDKYSTAQLNVIKGYIANVFDVQNQGGTLEIVDRLGHGVASAYTVDSVTLNEGTVTLVISGVAADSLLATSETGKAPVWYSVAGDTDTLKSYRATIAYDASAGTATVTFSIA